MTFPSLLILFSLYVTSAYASNEPSFGPSWVLTTAPSASNTFNNSAAPSSTTAPSEPDVCANTPGFEMTEWNNLEGEWHLQTLECDDIMVDCLEFGNFGQVKDYCCKCREGCADRCNEAVFTQPVLRNDSSVDAYAGFFTLFVPVACLVGMCVLFGLYVLRKKESQIAQASMAARRLEQELRENNGFTEEENTNIRFEQFVTRFLFQIVLPDKSNISAEAIRKASTKKDEETPLGKSASVDEGESSTDVVEEIPTRKIRLEQLASWTKPSAKDECCICLEAYATGETICVPRVKSCNHVFHESCIQEWLRKQDQCPLCRVDLLAD